MTTQHIRAYLDKIRWQYRIVDEQTIVTAFRCSIPFYDYGVPIEITLSEHWVSIQGVLQRLVSEARRSDILSLLSVLNANCRTVRFFLVENVVLIQTEIAVARCHLGSFVEALKNLCRYAATAGLEVTVLGTNPSVAQLYARVDSQSLPRFDARATSENLLLDFDLTPNRLSD